MQVVLERAHRVQQPETAPWHWPALPRRHTMLAHCCRKHAHAVSAPQTTGS